MADLTEWFNELARKERDCLLREATPANLDKLRLHIATSLPDFVPPADLKSEQFSDYVFEMCANEKAWNQATMIAVIKADDLFKQGLASDSRAALLDFAATCPWSAFKEVALNQATNYQ